MKPTLSIFQKSRYCLCLKTRKRPPFGGLFSRRFCVFLMFFNAYPQAGTRRADRHKCRLLRRLLKDDFLSISRRIRRGDRRKRRPLRGLFILLPRLTLITFCYRDKEDGRLIPTLPFEVSALIVSLSSAREPAHKVIVVLVSSR